MQLSSYVCPHGRRVDPAKDSCVDCDSTPIGYVTTGVGEGELLCEDALKRGLPDGLGVEGFAFESHNTALARMRACAARSDEMIAACDPQAHRWEQSAAKWADTAIKALKIIADCVHTRERIAAADRADRALERREREDRRH